MKWDELADQPCSAARALAVIGDRWTLMILRDSFLGVKRFEGFQSRLGISRTIVTDRLATLVREGVLVKTLYQANPVRHEYRLTEKGLALHPVIMALVHWGDVHYADERGPPLVHRHVGCDCDFAPVMTCSACSQPVHPRAVRTRAGPGFTSTPE